MKIKTQGIQYAGSKLKMLPIIADIIPPDMHFVLDGFSGTTRVSQLFSQMGYKVWANDIAPWSFVFANCYLKSKKPDSFYQSIIDQLNHILPQKGWFSENYGGLPDDMKKPFQLKNMQKLDAIRNQIDALALDDTDKSVLLTSLIEALNRVDSTIGHYTSYLKHWSKRSYKDLLLKMPKRVLSHQEHIVTQQDVFDILPKQQFDLVYFDPPYGSGNNKMPSSRVRYNAYYHFLKTVILNDHPALFGKNARREDSKDKFNKNPFEDYHPHVAANALYQLIKQANTQYVLLSYNSNGRITRSEIVDILYAHGKILKALSCDFKQNNMANLTTTNEWINADTAHQEYLFLLEK